jgi:hypothetical protein
LVMSRSERTSNTYTLMYFTHIHSCTLHSYTPSCISHTCTSCISLTCAHARVLYTRTYAHLFHVLYTRTHAHVFYTRTHTRVPYTRTHTRVLYALTHAHVCYTHSLTQMLMRVPPREDSFTAAGVNCAVSDDCKEEGASAIRLSTTRLQLQV